MFLAIAMPYRDCAEQRLPGHTRVLRSSGDETWDLCVCVCVGGDRPYLISGADDKLVKIWDYQTKTCVQTLEGHSHNIAAVSFHPELPIILTGRYAHVCQLQCTLALALLKGCVRVQSLATGLVTARISKESQRRHRMR